MLIYLLWIVLFFGLRVSYLRWTIVVTCLLWWKLFMFILGLIVVINSGDFCFALICDLLPLSCICLLLVVLLVELLVYLMFCLGWMLCNSYLFGFACGLFGVCWVVLGLVFYLLIPRALVLAVCGWVFCVLLLLLGLPSGLFYDLLYNIGSLVLWFAYMTTVLFVSTCRLSLSVFAAFVVVC